MQLQTKAGSSLDVKDNFTMSALTKAQEATGKAHVTISGGSNATTNASFAKLAASIIAKSNQKKEERALKKKKSTN